jgi:hypothetical protein
MARYLLCHNHEPRECRVAFAAWAGFPSPLRHRPALGNCALGGHSLWWTVEAEDEGSALGQLPEYVADRTEVVRIDEVPIP